MSERAATKRRVRGLLQHNRLSSLLALLLAYLPLLAVNAVIFFLLRPAPLESASQVSHISLSFTDLKGLAFQLLMLLNDPMAIVQPLLAWLPMVGTMAAFHLFVGQPLSIGVAGFFLAFLRGKNPKPTDVFTMFSGRYPRALGGAIYKHFWLLLWFATAFVLPAAALLSSPNLISASGWELSTQLYVFLAIVVICVLWFIAFGIAFINRLFAYCLTTTCIADRPRLHAFRTVRLSRKLMRGYKWRVILLVLSFAVYFLPAILALLAIPVSGMLGLEEALLGTIRTVATAVALINQLAWLYVLPYLGAAFEAFYIERKREALADKELTAADFTSPSKAGANGGSDDTAQSAETD